MKVIYTPWMRQFGIFLSKTKETKSVCLPNLGKKKKKWAIFSIFGFPSWLHPQSLNLATRRESCPSLARLQLHHHLTLITIGCPFKSNICGSK